MQMKGRGCGAAAKPPHHTPDLSFAWQPEQLLNKEECIQ